MFGLRTQLATYRRVTGTSRSYALAARGSHPRGRFTRVISNKGRPRAPDRLTAHRSAETASARGRSTMIVGRMWRPIPPRYAEHVPSPFGAVGETGASPSFRPGFFYWAPRGTGLLRIGAVPAIRSATYMDKGRGRQRLSTEPRHPDCRSVAAGAAICPGQPSKCEPEVCARRLKLWPSERSSRECLAARLSSRLGAWPP
jgi:hypothetical protein